MAVFIEKSPVKSSNCYTTIKTASMIIKFGAKIMFTGQLLCNDMLSLKFPVSMVTRGHLKIAVKIHLKVLQLLNELRWSQRLFGVGYTLPYDRPKGQF
jgi:hypothetical protein